MAELAGNVENEAAASRSPGEYVVIARRYRPQLFDDLIGQEHVAQGLSNAISAERVGHAYLFTGARGVGKTSAARIFAKALNCETGPTTTPCNRCDACQRIAGGDDVDVLEIDGASNRGIDEIRQLRQNVNIRPSRARFKIYIIDEVHMLTREAFNALLKTLEEPPEHVKFIFCTTEANKIPITILSRCQRFDFAGIQGDAIARRLQAIVAAEGVAAEPEALQLLARRAAGSMRDSQSLLEQLLAFADGQITVASVHAMLGTAGDQRLTALAECLLSRDPAGALGQFDAAIRGGVDPGLLLEQLFGYFRDCLAAALGCPPEAGLYAAPADWPKAAAAGQRLGTATILAAMQILDHSLARMHISIHARILAEMALVRICGLEELDELAGLIGQFQSGGPSAATLPAGSPTASGAPAARPTAAPPGRPAPSTAKPSPGRNGGTPAGEIAAPPPAPQPVLSLTAANALEVWTSALDRVAGMMAEQARLFDRAALAAPNRLVVSFKPEYAVAKATCEQPAQLARFQQALAEVAGQAVGLEFRLEEINEPAAPAPQLARPHSPHQRLFEVGRHPLVQRAGELFGAVPASVSEPPKPR